jgi:Uma2 family endonuclease
MTLVSQDRWRMNVSDFVAFLETRPDEEKWELVDGRPILSPSPVFKHQIIVGNVIVELTAALRTRDAAFVAIPGIGVRVDDFNAPVPDVMIRPLDSLDGSFCDDMLVAFEVLSPGTAQRDRRWKRQTYAALPSSRHYVTISPKSVEVALFSRHTDFSQQRLVDPAASLDLDALGISVPLQALYCNTGLPATEASRSDPC